MKVIITIIIVGIIAQFSTGAIAQDAATRQQHFLLDKGVALEGYDAVSYFSGKPEKGSKSFMFTDQGVVYRFSSAAHLESFKKNPDKYEPQYGGWCAYALGARGAKVEVDPENYKIVNGKLYLFYKNFFSNTLDDWNKEEAHLKSNADLSWNKIVNPTNAKK